jgi:tetratricopeptide (TPR) repeat protein
MKSDLFKLIFKSFIFIIVLLSFHENIIYSQELTPQEKSIKLLSDGDEFAEIKFENQNALDKYLVSLTINPKDYEAYWRISRSYVDIGEHMPNKTDEEKSKQELVYKKAYGYADSAVKVNPGGSMGYTRRAIANGRIALFKGIWDNIGLVKQTKADLEKAIELDPNNATAFYVFGRTHAKVSEKSKIIRWPLGLGWANLDDAVKNYEKSISLRPDFIMYRLDAARAYVEQDEYAKANEHLKVIETLATKDEDDGRFRKEAKELFEEIKNK